MIIVSVCNLFETWLYTYDKFWERSKLQRENMESVYGEGVFSLFFAFVFVCFGKGGGSLNPNLWMGVAIYKNTTPDKMFELINYK